MDKRNRMKRHAQNYEQKTDKKKPLDQTDYVQNTISSDVMARTICCQIWYEGL